MNTACMADQTGNGSQKLYTQGLTPFVHPLSNFVG